MNANTASTVRRVLNVKAVKSIIKIGIGNTFCQKYCYWYWQYFSPVSLTSLLRNEAILWQNPQMFASRRWQNDYLLKHIEICQRKGQNSEWQSHTCCTVMITHTAVLALPVLRHSICRSSTRQLYRGSQPLNADKTELLWAGSRYGSALIGSSGPSLRLGSEVITTSDHVRGLEATLSSDLSINKHVSNICATCFQWLRQLRHVQRSLDTESAATVVHAFVT